jgi:hypothetical protein
MIVSVPKLHLLKILAFFTQTVYRMYIRRGSGTVQLKTEESTMAV